MYTIKLKSSNRTMTVKHVIRNVSLKHVGRKGMAGAQGEQGDTGLQGPQGIQGATGSQGPAGATGATGPGVATGGTTGQILAKNSNTNYDTEWVDSSTGDVISVNGQSGVVVLESDDISDTGQTNKYVTAAEKVKLSNLSGTNTGDQDLSGLVPNTRTVNGHALSSNVTVTKSDVSLGNVDNTSDANKPVSTAQATAIGVVQSDVNAHEARTDNPHSVTKAQVGLSNADNTTDAGKPISTATQTALNAKLSKADSTATSTIDYNGKSLELNFTDAASSSDALKIINAGQGSAMDITQTDTTNNDPIVNIVLSQDTGIGLKINKTDADNSEGNIRLDGQKPEIEFVDYSVVDGYPTGPAGKLEIRSAQDQLQINSRTAADSGFEEAYLFQRKATGGGLYILGENGLNLNRGSGLSTKVRMSYNSAQQAAMDDYIELQSNYVANNDGDFAIRHKNSLGADSLLLSIDSSTNTTSVTNLAASTGAFSSDVTVPDEVYGAGWNGSLEVPTKNALYDKIETIGGGVSDGDKGDVTVASSGTVWTIDGKPSGAFVGTTDTQTLTNKTLTSPAISTPTGIVKGDVGLGNVDNTSDATKAAATETLTNKTIDTDGPNTIKIKGMTLSASSSNTGTLNFPSISSSQTLVTTTGTATLTNKTLTSPAITTPTGIVKGDVGLGNVDNTSNATERAATRTLTNARITKRTGTTTSSATPTINTDNVDLYSLTAQTADITSFTTNLSGTPTEGQTLWIAITGTAARAITWGASFEASTVALPTTTVTTARLDVGFVWNSVTSKWRCVATA